jgi:hypothetical protein
MGELAGSEASQTKLQTSPSFKIIERKVQFFIYKKRTAM